MTMTNPTVEEDRVAALERGEARSGQGGKRGKRVKRGSRTLGRRSAGCPRCRMDLVVFAVEVKLPRFTMRPGDSWDLPQVRNRADGGIELGHGVAPRGTFAVAEVDHRRACHNGQACPGDAGDDPEVGR